MRRIFEFSSKYQVYKDLVKKGGVLKLIGFSPPISVPSRGSAITFIGRRQKREKRPKTLCWLRQGGACRSKVDGMAPSQPGIRHQLSASSLQAAPALLFQISAAFQGWGGAEKHLHLM